MVRTRPTVHEQIRPSSEVHTPRQIYQISRPCEYTGECPHDREIATCEAMDRNKASKCPSSVSPYAIRRGSITQHLFEDVPEKVVSDRLNVSLDVLAKHYDRRGEREKAEQWRVYWITSEITGTFYRVVALQSRSYPEQPPHQAPLIPDRWTEQPALRHELPA